MTDPNPKKLQDEIRQLEGDLQSLRSELEQLIYKVQGLVDQKERILTATSTVYNDHQPDIADIYERVHLIEQKLGLDPNQPSR